jgi:hypothetical protein
VKSLKAVFVLMMCVAVIPSLSACSLLPTLNPSAESAPSATSSEVAPETTPSEASAPGDDYDEYAYAANEDAPLNDLNWVAERLGSEHFVKPVSSEGYESYTAVAKYHESCVLVIAGDVPEAENWNVTIVLMSRFDPYLMTDILSQPLSQLPDVLSKYEDVCGPNPTTPPPFPSDDATQLA